MTVLDRRRGERVVESGSAPNQCGYTGCSGRENRCFSYWFVNKCMTVRVRIFHDGVRI